jgi:hypothetical protein
MPPDRPCDFFRQMTDKIVLREYDLSHEKAQEWASTLAHPRLRPG